MPLEQRALALVASTDIEGVQEQLLSELTALCGAQSGALWVAGERPGLRLRAWRGMLNRASLLDHIDARLVQARAWKAAGALLVPLFLPTGELMGLAQLSDPLAASFSDEILKSCNALAPFGASALRNASRFATLQRQGLRERETGAYTLSYFTDYATKEIYKARRYGRAFALITLSLDNINALRQRLGHTVVREAQMGVLRVISQILRDSDVVARASEQEIHVLLPETDFFGGLMYLRRALNAVRDDTEVKAIETRVSLGLVGAVASFPRDGDEFDELLLRCRRRMEDRRGSLQHVLTLDPLPFWDEFELLLGNARSPRLPEVTGDPSRRGKVAESLFDELQFEIAQEFLREPKARGLLYVGAAAVKADLPVVRALDHAPADFAPRVYALGRHDDLDEHSAVTPIFLEGDEHLKRNEFLLWVGDGAAYALLQRRGRGQSWGFHTSDPTLVEGLISKLQHAYDLQPY